MIKIVKDLNIVSALQNRAIFSANHSYLSFDGVPNAAGKLGKTTGHGFSLDLVDNLPRMPVSHEPSDCRKIQ